MGFKIGQQAERVGIIPTLPVVLAKGIALEQVVNQNPRYVGKEYTYNKGYSLIYFLLNHVIKSLFLHPLDWRIYHVNYTKPCVNPKRGEPTGMKY
jgi:hypothetical protein